jgi:CHAD domain-containing protein
MAKRSTRLGEAMLAAALGHGRDLRQSLARPDDADGEAIHEARKAIRRLRALLSLATDRVDGLEPLDAQLERLGDGFSVRRDAHVKTSTARRVARRHPSTDWSALIALLERQRRIRLAQARTKDRGFARRQRAIGRVEIGLQALAWPMRKKDLRAALARSQRRYEKAEHRVEGAPRPENCHRWRRRARRLRLQLEAVRELASKLAREQATPSLKKQLHSLCDLADALGWYQDLRVLRAAIEPMRRLRGRATLLAQLNDARLLAFLEFSPDREQAQWIRSRGRFG